MCKFLWASVLLFVLSVQGSRAQSEECSYGPGSIATAVIVTVIATILLLALGYVIWKRYWIRNRDKNLVLETDPEKGKEEYAYDNAAFGEAASTPFQKVTEKNGKVASTKSKWSPWSPLGALTTRNEKAKTLDDFALQTSEIKTVSLKSHDFTGLGFNISGNMRDGIFIKDILHRGPASESGKLNSGDRIKSVTINFEHVVYEDALTILSYASPYEVVLEAQGGKPGVLTQTPSKVVHLGHPLYRSSSTTDLIQIQKTSKKRLFPADNVSTASSPYSSLQKSRLSNVPTLERNRSNSPKPDNQNASKVSKAQSPQQLKTQLEQKIFPNHKQQLKTKDESPSPQPEAVQKTENKYQKFGIKVLPVELKLDQPREQTSPKSAELSQNENNINLERHLDNSKVVDNPEIPEGGGIDEVDKLGRKPPPIKKREKNVKNDDSSHGTLSSSPIGEDALNMEMFTRNGSGIKRDKDGIPQEIPSHMLNAAVAARRNRKASIEINSSIEDMKSPKKPKGRAPAPPDEKIKSNVNIFNDPLYSKSEETIATTATDPLQSEVVVSEVKISKNDYTSDSDAETDNMSSVNTIELNASDITIHQTEDNDEMQNRRTASTGDLTKIQRTRKISTGTLERAQSLDITDTTMPSLNKKRKGTSLEKSLDSKSGSDDSLYGNALVQKEPRLSLALDGINTFQRNRLKKSTEWGNLEDAIVNLENSECISEVQTDDLNKINDQSKEDNNENVTETSLNIAKPFKLDLLLHQNAEEEDFENNKNLYMNSNNTVEPGKLTSVSFLTLDLQKANKNTDNPDTVMITSTASENSATKTILQEVSVTPATQTFIILPYSAKSLETFLDSEKRSCETDPYYSVPNEMYDLNVSDDMKVSRHSLGSLETSDNCIHLHTSSNGNVSNITIGEKHEAEDLGNESFLFNKKENVEDDGELYVTAMDATLVNENVNNTDYGFQKVSVISPPLIKNNVPLPETYQDVNDTVTIEGPTSLTLEIHGDGSKIANESSNLQISNNSISIPTSLVEEDLSPKSNYSLTYITEIKVSTPNDDNNVVVTPEIPLNSNKGRNSIESNIKQFESQIQNANSAKNTNEKVDPAQELHKIQEIVEEQLKKLPEMRFSTSSYEAPKSPETYSSQIDQLRSNFEKSPPKTPPKADITKSRIPVATAKTPPTSPERRDSRNFDLEVNKEIVAIMSSPVHSTPISSSIKYQPKVVSKNVSVTSIRTNSKIPSGLPNRPPVPPRRYDSNDGESNNRFSTNGNLDSSFKQWVFTSNDGSLTVTENKQDHK